MLRVLGFGAALIIVTLVRLIISAAGINDVEQNGVAFITVGILAACACAACRALGERPEPEVYGAVGDGDEDADIGFGEDIFTEGAYGYADTAIGSFSPETFPDQIDDMSGFIERNPITELFDEDEADADGDDALDELLDPDGDTDADMSIDPDIDPDGRAEGGDEE